MATYRSDKARWRIWAEDLDLLEESGAKVTRQSCSDRRALLSLAEKTIREKTAKGRLLLDGNHQVGRGQKHPPELRQEDRKALASVFKRAFRIDEAMDVVDAPGDFDGGLLFVDGDLHVSGDWDLAEYAAVLITGDCVVDGLLLSLQEEERWLAVLGDLRAENLLFGTHLHVAGERRRNRSPNNVKNHCSRGLAEHAAGYEHLP